MLKSQDDTHFIEEIEIHEEQIGSADNLSDEDDRMHMLHTKQNSLPVAPKTR